MPVFVWKKVDWATILFVRPSFFQKGKWELVFVRGRGFQCTIKTLGRMNDAVTKMNEEASRVAIAKEAEARSLEENN